MYADPGADVAGGLGDRVLPGALARAAHHDQVAVAERVPHDRAVAAPGPQPQGPWGADRHDGAHGVLRRAAADRVAVPGNAVAPVAVVAQTGRPERFAQLVGVPLGE